MIQERKNTQTSVKKTFQTSQKSGARRTSTFFSKKFQFASRKTESNFFMGEETTF